MKRTLQICVCTHGVKRFSIFRTFHCKHNGKEENNILKYINDRMPAHIQENQSKPRQDDLLIQVFYCLGLLWAIIKNSLLFRHPIKWLLFSGVTARMKMWKWLISFNFQTKWHIWVTILNKAKTHPNNYFCHLTFVNKYKFINFISLFCSSEDLACSNQRERNVVNHNTSKMSW